MWVDSGDGLVTESCPTLCNPMDCSLPGSSVHGTSQARYWSGLPFPSPGDPPNSVIEPVSLALAGGFFTTEPPGKPFWTLFHGCFSSSHIDLLARLSSLFRRLFSQMFAWFTMLLHWVRRNLTSFIQPSLAILSNTVSQFLYFDLLFWFS